MKSLNRIFAYFISACIVVVFATACQKEMMNPDNKNEFSSSTRSQTQALQEANSQVSRDDFDIDAVLYNDCTAEWVHYTGSYQTVTEYTINGKRVSGVFHGNTKNVVGIGLTSGNRYVGLENFIMQFSGSFVNESYTTTFLKRDIAVGGGVRFAINQTFRLTINANGTTTASIDNISTSCL